MLVMAASRQRDGRVERGERSRRAVADALLGLLRDGVGLPTAAQVAERAGVSLRLVHHHFRDREALFAAAMDRQREHLAPFVQSVAGLAFEPLSPVVRSSLGAIRAIKRNQVAQVFAPELDRYAGADREDLLAAACTASSWSAWEELRNYQGLSVPRARRVMRRALSTLFESFE